MGHKVNPHGLRVGVIKKWDSNWFVKKSEMGDLIVEDYNIRKFLKEKLFAAGLARVEIERTADRAKVILHVAKPGMVIGRGGEEIGKLEKEVEALDLAISALANVNRPQGTWIVTGEEGQCSQCKVRARLIYGVRYCPFCGAILTRERREKHESQ